MEFLFRSGSQDRLVNSSVESEDLILSVVLNERGLLFELFEVLHSVEAFGQLYDSSKLLYKACFYLLQGNQICFKVRVELFHFH